MEAEVASQANKNKLLVDLIEEKRYEIIDKIREMAQDTQLWRELKVIRTSVNLDRGPRKRPSGHHYGAGWHDPWESHWRAGEREETEEMS